MPILCLGSQDKSRNGVGLPFTRQVLANIIVIIAIAIVTVTVVIITIISPIMRYQIGIQLVGSKQCYILCRQQIKTIKQAHAILRCLVLTCPPIRYVKVSDSESRRKPVSRLAILVWWTGPLWILIASSSCSKVGSKLKKNKTPKHPKNKCTTNYSNYWINCYLDKSVSLNILESR